MILFLKVYNIMDNKLDVIIVGFAKCGTTFLMNLLRKHDKVEMCKNELHYFDLHYSDKNYLNKKIDFSKKNKIFIEKSPSYCVIEPVAKRIYNYNKNVKIIFCIRNHEERILSHINMERGNRNEPRTLDNIINSELKELSTLLKTEIVDVFDHKNINLDVECMKGKMASTENIIIAMWDLIVDKVNDMSKETNCTLYSLKLYETPRNFVEYRGE